MAHLSRSDFPNLSKASLDVDEAACVLRSPILDGFLWLTHGVTTRQFAPPESDTFSLMEQVRARLVPGGQRIICCEQVHGSRVSAVAAGGQSGGDIVAGEHGTVVQLTGVDGLLTDVPNMPIAIRTADCVPLVIVDVRRKRIALVHAGWRGSFERIAEKAVGEMARRGSDPADLVAWLGPAILRDAYEVGAELAGRFRREFPEWEEIADGRHLDLVLLNACQLREAGIPGAQIHAANYCTFRNRKVCYSHRAEREHAGRMVTYAMILGPAVEQ
ncbi:MAG: peptidoglycan editing factor PgeF [Candidatus Sumerlaeia bacterium]|nr:peptidoglycan editing factor PgeF [Candidatus Sumerlaeia bacterium]